MAANRAENTTRYPQWSSHQKGRAQQVSSKRGNRKSAISTPYMPLEMHALVSSSGSKDSVANEGSDSLTLLPWLDQQRQRRECDGSRSFKECSSEPATSGSRAIKDLACVRTTSQQSTMLAEWFLMELVPLLWSQDLLALARSAIGPQWVVRKSWRKLLLARGFIANVVTKLAFTDIFLLESWGGQGWDVWRRTGRLGEELTMLRHWQYGTTVLLTGGSNGWFEFQASAMSRPQIFYSSGSLEESEGSQLMVEVNQLAESDHTPGCAPMLRIHSDPLDRWQWLREDTGLCILHEPRGLYRPQRRLKLHARGFYAFGDICPWEPSLIVDRGVQLTPAPTIIR